jgi:hypothetical protein
MRSYQKLFFLMPLWLLACSPNKTPQDILTQDQMVRVLVDVHIIDGSLFETPQMPDSLYKYGSARYQYAFKAHGTDSTQFRKSFNYYTKKPDQLFDIYEKVVPILKAKLDSSAKVRVKADSLNRIKQNKLNEAIAKRAADSIARINKRKTDPQKKTDPPQNIKAGKQKLL